MRIIPGMPRIYLSDAPYAQNPDTFKKNPNIKLVINTSIDSPASEGMKQFYVLNGIDYLWAPIEDIEKVPDPTFLPRIVNYVKKRGNSGDILIHCSAGINRSALVTAAILWHTTPNRHLYWHTPKDLIDYMRSKQMLDRKQYLLINNTFYKHLIQYLQ